MARFARINSQIRANRLILTNRFRVPPRLNTFLRANRASGAIRANRSHVMKIVFFCLFLRIDSIRANRPDLRCKSPGHLSSEYSRSSETDFFLVFGPSGCAKWSGCLPGSPAHSQADEHFSDISKLGRAKLSATYQSKHASKPRWAKSCDSYRRIASESYCCDSNR